MAKSDPIVIQNLFKRLPTPPLFLHVFSFFNPKVGEKSNHFSSHLILLSGGPTCPLTPLPHLSLLLCKRGFANLTDGPAVFSLSRTALCIIGAGSPTIVYLAAALLVIFRSKWPCLDQSRLPFVFGVFHVFPIFFCSPPAACWMLSHLVHGVSLVIDNHH